MLTINNIKINNNSAPLIIPEIGINHSGILENAFKIVDSAKRAGAKIIKHQTHIPDDEMSLEAKKISPGNSKKNIYEIIKRNNLSDYDLLIGPLTSDAFNYTSELLENESVQLVSPLSKVIPKKNVVNTITNNDILFEMEY